MEHKDLDLLMEHKDLDLLMEHKDTKTQRIKQSRYSAKAPHENTMFLRAEKNFVSSCLCVQLKNPRVFVFS